MFVSWLWCQPAGNQGNWTNFHRPHVLVIGCLALLVGGGFYHLLAPRGAGRRPRSCPPRNPSPFSSFFERSPGGCAALTGTEAVANGVQYFRPPESRNAGVTLVWMASILALSFLGVTFLAHYYISCRAQTRLWSPCNPRTSSAGWIYYMIQAATAVILLTRRQTSFAGFPMLASIMAKDRFPAQATRRAWVTAWSSATEFSSWPGSPVAPCNLRRQAPTP